MTPAHVVEITTPKKYVLRGLWFGPKRPKNVVVFIHGLGGSAFSMRSVIAKLANKDTSVLTFNNRGFEKVSEIKKASGKKSDWKKAGAAHEVFTECIDDIQGAINFARKQKAKRIFLAGHSTGCQKSVYWAYKKQGKGIKGIILLAPVSDYAAEVKHKGLKKVERAAKAARALVRRGKPHSLLPEGLWNEVLDAQRFLSLYTPDSVEEIFPYAQTTKQPRMLQSVRVPILALWAEKEEFAGGRTARDIERWFAAHIHKGQFVVVPRVGHGFKGGEKRVVGAIRRFIEAR